ncbi:MAG: hypothetical protein WCW33_04430 [Candidatus Babeliales bacterium]|jgi:hypothetical protein
MNIHSFVARCVFMVVISNFVFGAAHHALTGEMQTQVLPSSKFTLITTLYNEKHEKRYLEFITCLEKNLKNSSIDTIHVAYDTAKDDASGSVILNYLKSKNIKISYISERASFGDLFEIANKEYPNSKIVVSNADIFFNETLALLEPYDLRNKFLALTRWNVRGDGTLVEFFARGNSQDTWIFQLPLPTFENDSIKMGILDCDLAIAYQAQKSGLILFNPSLSIQCCHLHLSEMRNYARSFPYNDLGKIKFIPKCTVMEINEQQRELYLKNLRLSFGRRKPIILPNAYV